MVLLTRSCASTSLTVTSTPYLTSIYLTPADPSIEAGSAESFTAYGYYSDGNTYDITSWINWSSSDTYVADVSSGSTQSYHSGLTTITAYDASTGTSGSTTLTVTEPP